MLKTLLDLNDADQSVLAALDRRRQAREVLEAELRRRLEAERRRGPEGGATPETPERAQ